MIAALLLTAFSVIVTAQALAVDSIPLGTLGLSVILFAAAIWMSEGVYDDGTP